MKPFKQALIKNPPESIGFQIHTAATEDNIA